MPPSDASAPGSIGKNTPWSRRCSFSALRVTPGSITQSRSSAWTSSTLFMSRKSMQTPPAGALTCPSSEVPVPNAITGTPWPAQMRTTSCTSAVSCANTTASGGCDFSQVVVWACWSRTACEVTRRLPNRAASFSTAAATAFGSGRFGLLVMVVPTLIPSTEIPWQRIYRGSRDVGGRREMDTMTTHSGGHSAPFLSSVMQIEPQWIDYNGHLNMAYYNVMFDRAIDELGFVLAFAPSSKKTPTR